PIRTQPAYAVPISAVVASNSGQHEGIARDPWDGARVVHQSIYMDDAPEDGLPCLTMVQRVNDHAIRLGWSERSDYSVVVLRRGPQHWIQYDAWSDVKHFTPEQLCNAPENYGEILSDQDLRNLTNQDLLPRTRRLAQTITRDARTVFDKATALNMYLSGSNYFYTLNLPPLPAEHPIDEFINETRRGHCELYASALALMLRALGVPTRVVAGYRGGDWSEADRAYTVRADMAHLWVEVYFPGCGWVTFDPSPRENESLVARNWVARTVSRYVLRAKIFWYRDVVGFDSALQLALFQNVSLGLIGLGSEWIGAVDSTRIIGPRSPWLPLALIAAVLAVFLTWRRRSRALSRSLYKHVLTADQVRAVRLYRGLRRRLERIGVPVAGHTAEEIRRSLEEEPILADTTAVQDIIETYNAVRFGGRPFPRDHYARLTRLQRSLQRRPQAQ
ncbi:MAG: transglutaminase-like domain-containing protein, partial [Candidatus Hydrogenedentes bacterium]|nr:transglutaminase-like domain-containing protein [Candidatus Hydrogenedentota bacterium]